MTLTLKFVWHAPASGKNFMRFQFISTSGCDKWVKIKMIFNFKHWFSLIFKCPSKVDLMPIYSFFVVRFSEFLCMYISSIVLPSNYCTHGGPPLTYSPNANPLKAKWTNRIIIIIWLVENLLLIRGDRSFLITLPLRVIPRPITPPAWLAGLGRVLVDHWRGELSTNTSMICLRKNDIFIPRLWHYLKLLIVEYKEPILWNVMIQGLVKKLLFTVAWRIFLQSHIPKRNIQIKPFSWNTNIFVFFSLYHNFWAV